MAVKKVLVATRNRDKARELRSILRQSGIEGLALDDVDPDGRIPNVEETGATLIENAFLKARTIFSLTGVPTIADDTGLEVDALGGGPGVYAARYAGEDCTYEDNLNQLLSRLADVPNERRTARFRTVACYVGREQELWTEGVVEGVIAEKPQGSGGFGYDPVFYLPRVNKTYAQLSEEEKNELSHRGMALRKLIELLHNASTPAPEAPAEPLSCTKFPNRGD